LQPTEKYDRQVYGYSEKYFECPQQQLLPQTAIYQWRKLTSKENLTKIKAVQK
jgi:hypothetical protein